VDMEQAEKLQEKLLKAKFDFEDFLEQMAQLKKMGPLESVIGMIPGMGKQLKGIKFDEREIERTAAIIKSMTAQERRNPQMIDGSRKKRIAAGSGSSVQMVNQLLKQFFNMQKMFSKFNKKKLKGLPSGMLPF
ncbi:MAG: signal recognition particle protein, partial [candidate division Zixibacteria bacterium]|nr:signal recognition particle protein [candidate division Zixibacteria bacterium]